MSGNKINILIVDDDPGDCRLVKLALAKSSKEGGFAVDTAGTLADGLACLKRHSFDLLLLDLNLPDSTGIETVKEVYNTNSKVPIIVLTGLSDEEVGVQAISEGAEDYLVKGQSLQQMLVRSIRYAIERRQVKLRLHKSEKKYTNLTENLTQVIYSADPTTFVARYVNISVENIYGYIRKEWLSDPNLREDTIYPDDKKRVLSEFKKLQKKKKDSVVEYRIVRKDEKVRWVEDHVSWERDEKGVVISLNGIVNDITERKKAEGRQELTSQILNLLNNSGGKNGTIREILSLIKEFIGFDAVGIRLKEGEDFPYYEVHGYPNDFVEAERYLCSRVSDGGLIHDSEGKPVYECMCGNVICGRINRSLPFFTEKGSFWTNSTTKYLAGGGDQGPSIRPRNRCNSAGYESLAIIPLRSDKEIIGLIQLNDTRKDMLTSEIVGFPEELGASIGIALGRKRTNDQLQEYCNHLEQMVEERTTELNTTNTQLQREINEHTLSEQRQILSVNVLEALNQPHNKIDSIHQILLLAKEHTNVEAVGIRLREGEDFPYYETKGFSEDFVEAERYPCMRDANRALIRSPEGNVCLECMCGHVISGSINPSLPFFTKAGCFWTNSTTEFFASISKEDLPSCVRGGCNAAGYESVALIPLRCDEEIIGLLQLNDSQRYVFTPDRIHFFEGLGASIGIAIKGIESTLVVARNEIKYDADVKTGFSELPMIFCHSGQINQVFLNILLNAAQERDNNGTITIRTYASDDGVVCEISDDRPGISPDSLSKIFDPFFTTKPVGKGTGLGLSVSYDIITNKHNGELVVDSTVGEGTKFTIKLPVGTKESDEKEIISDGKENSIICG